MLAVFVIISIIMSTNHTVFDVNDLRITTFNCRSVKNSLQTVRNLCSTHDVIALQETWLLPHDLTMFQTIDVNFTGRGTSAIDSGAELLEGRPYGGMAFLWRKDLANSIEYISYNDERLLGLAVKGADKQMLTLNVYMPTAGIDNRDLYQEYLGKVGAIVSDSKYHHTMITADWNAKPGTVEFELLKDFCDSNNLIISDVQSLPADSFTYVSDAHDTCSWLDHIVTSHSVDSACSNFVVHYDEVISDHKPLSVNVNLGHLPRIERSVHNNAAPNKVKWDKLTSQQEIEYSTRVRDNLGNIQLPISALLCNGTGTCDHESHKLDCQNYLHAINNAMVNAAEIFESNIVTNHHENAIEGWNEVVRDAHNIYRRELLFWYSCGRPRQGVVWSDKQLAQSRFKYALRACRKQHDMLRADAMANDLSGLNLREFWRKVQSKPDDAGISASIDGHTGIETIANHWAEHYENILNSVQNETDRELLETCLNTTVNDDFSLSASVLENARHQLKSRKSVGQDGIAPEHIKLSPKEIDIHFALCFNCMIRHSYIPESFMPVTIVPIVKNTSGDITSSNNYRPIAIATSVSKLFEISILTCLSDKMITSDNQFGFKSGHSTDQCIFLLKERIRRYVDLDGPVYCCFIDASKAFDRVCYPTLFLKLIDRGFPISIVKILKYWYENQTMSVSWNGCLSRSFHTTNGVRQGGILSPSLFGIYFDVLSSALSKIRTGCHLNTALINHLIYADDLVLMSPSLSGLRKLLDTCTSVAPLLSIRFNPEKTVCLCFKPARYDLLPEFDVFLCGTRLSFVNYVKYLGHFITDDLNDLMDMQKIRRGLYFRGNLLIRKFHRCSIKVKVILFRSFITPLYCSHLWVNYRKSDFISIRTAYRRIFRMFFNLPRDASMTTNLIKFSLPDLHIIIRKMTSSLFSRFETSNNSLCTDVFHPVSFVTFGPTFYRRFYSIRPFIDTDDDDEDSS